VDEGEELTHFFIRRPATVIGVAFLVANGVIEIIVIKDTGD